MEQLCTVVIPAYNAETVLENAVRSVQSNTYQNFEIIIIDDCSADNTWKLMKSLAAEDSRIKILQNKQNLGVAKTRNYGFSESKGDFVALLDADDAWTQDKLEKQLALMKDKKCDFSYTGYQTVNSKGLPTGSPYRVPTKLDFDEMLKENYVGASTVILTREVAKGSSMPSQYAHEDYAFVMSLLQSNRTAFGVNEPLMLYRKWEQNRSGNKLLAAKNRYIIFREHLNLPFFKSISAFVSYGIRGIKKHK